MMLNITDFGAKAEEGFNNAEAIQAAINKAHQLGGGTVVIPGGKFYSTTIHLKSYVTLHLESGCRLTAWPTIEDYAIDKECQTMDRAAHFGIYLIYAEDAEYITISGSGVIDGQGPCFWEEITAPRKWIPAKIPRVSPLLDFRNVNDLRISDVTLYDSPGWTLHAFKCERVWIRGIRIDNYMFGPNTDGLDINGCRDVMVSDCHISCSDDCIVLKTTENSQTCERVTVTNCVLKTNCVALKCGTESWFDFRQITMSNCVAYQCNRLFGLYSFDGATMEQIQVYNVSGDTKTGFPLNRPIHIDTRKRNEDSKPSLIRDVVINGLNVNTDGRILLTAAEGSRVERLKLSNVTMQYPTVENPNFEGSLKARSFQYSSATPEARIAESAIVAWGIEGLEIDGLKLAWPDEPETALSAFWGRKLKGGVVDLSTVTPSTRAAELADLDEVSTISVKD